MLADADKVRNAFWELIVSVSDKTKNRSFAVEHKIVESGISVKLKLNLTIPSMRVAVQTFVLSVDKFGMITVEGTGFAKQAVSSEDVMHDLYNVFYEIHKQVNIQVNTKHKHKVSDQSEEVLTLEPDVFNEKFGFEQ